MRKFFLAISLLTIISCDSSLHQEEPAYNEIDIETIELVNGIYDNLKMVHDKFYFSVMSRGEDVNRYISYDFPMEEFKDTVNIMGCGGEGINIGNVGTDEIYHKLYTAIISLNKILETHSEIEFPELVGEIYLLRAYAYFKLARIFGTPPLITETEVSFAVEKPTFEEVYVFIEKDMLNALKFLPDTYSKARIPSETPHKGVAKALLAEIYLAWAGFPINDNSKYEKSALFAGEVIQQADYYGFGLLGDFADLWKSENKHNKENVLGLFFNAQNSKIKNSISSLSVFVIPWDSSLIFRSFYNPQFKFYKTFPNNYRKSISYFMGKEQMNLVMTPDTAYYYRGYYAYDPFKSPCAFIDGVVPLKWVEIEQLESNGVNSASFNGSDITLYLIRYAQTLLTYAEASARSGKLDESAYEAVNMVRRRANKLDPSIPSKYDLARTLSTEQFLDSVVWERAWELCSEPEGRWFDIIRLDLKDKLSEYRYDFDFPFSVLPEYLNKNWYFYLIPLEDRMNNPDFEN